MVSATGVVDETDLAAAKVTFTIDGVPNNSWNAMWKESVGKSTAFNTEYGFHQGGRTPTFEEIADGANVMAASVKLKGQDYAIFSAAVGIVGFSLLAVI